MLKGNEKLFRNSFKWAQFNMGKYVWYGGWSFRDSSFLKDWLVVELGRTRVGRGVHVLDVHLTGLVGSHSGRCPGGWDLLGDKDHQDDQADQSHKWEDGDEGNVPGVVVINFWGCSWGRSDGESASLVYQGRIWEVGIVVRGAEEAVRLEGEDTTRREKRLDNVGPSCQIKVVWSWWVRAYWGNSSPGAIWLDVVESNCSKWFPNGVGHLGWGQVHQRKIVNSNGINNLQNLTPVGICYSQPVGDKRSGWANWLYPHVVDSSCWNIPPVGWASLSIDGGRFVRTKATWLEKELSLRTVQEDYDERCRSYSGLRVGKLQEERYYIPRCQISKPQIIEVRITAI